MKKNYILLAFSLAFLLFSSNSNAQTKTYWDNISRDRISQTELVARKSQPYVSLYYHLDLNMMKQKLSSAPMRGASMTSNVIIEFPDVDEKMVSYEVFEAPVLAPSLQASHPEIRSYIGRNVDHPSSLIRFSITPQGLHAMVLSSKQGMQLIDPFTKNGNNYIVYSKKNLPVLVDSFFCDFQEEMDDLNPASNKTTAQATINDGNLRTYRLALASTIEYSAFHIDAAGVGGGTLAQKKAAVLAAMVVTMTRVNGVYERDLSTTMEIVANNENVIFVDSDTLDNDNAGTLINQSQTVIDANIGTANYDIGHTFSTGGGGLAGLGVVCISGQKARGITGSPSPVGDAYDIDYVAHEMGHQFGAPHTFNGDTGNCAGANRTASNAYEPGSGSTIMAYAGICSPQNVQNNSDAYFHQKSLQMIWDNIVANATCAALSATGNSAPTAEAGNSYTIPISTPYKLTGSSTDASPSGTSTHTYTWEQYDLGPAGVPTETTTSGPLVRSFEGTDDPTRVIPRMEDLLETGGSTTWEKLVSVGRGINYRLTVRDNDVSGGRTAVDFMAATTTTSAGPFVVTSQATSGISWTQGTTETVTWDVAGTTANGVNTANVNILLSTDGGLTYDTVLASNTPNDGSQDITVPNVAAPYCRVMVEAVGNIFFNINSVNFAIGYTVTNTCLTYSNNTPLVIPDGVGSNSPGAVVSNLVNVADDGMITDVNITMAVTHTYIEDLVIALSHPDNTQVILWGRQCDGEDAFNITFDDEAATAIPTSGCTNPYNGTFQPYGNLSDFDGKDSPGNWRVLTADYWNGDTGQIDNWTLELCMDVALPLSAEEFEGFTNFSLFPNPNNGEFTVKFSNNSGGDKVRIQVSDIRGRLVYNNIYANVGAEFNQTINMGQLQSGLYLVNVNDGVRDITKKIIIE